MDGWMGRRMDGWIVCCLLLSIVRIRAVELKNTALKNSNGNSELERSVKQWLNCMKNHLGLF